MASHGQLAEFVDEGFELLSAIKNTALQTILAPFRLAISKQARRAYIASILLGITIFTLLATAVLSYVLFYLTYLPRAGFERNIYLQFDNVFLHDVQSSGVNTIQSASGVALGGWRRHPYGFVSLGPDLASALAYDVTIELTLPRTRENRDAGNFMLEVSLLASTSQGSLIGSSEGAIAAPPWLSGQAIHDEAQTDPRSPEAQPPLTIQPLAVSRRSAILPYRSFPLEILHRLTQLHLYLFEVRSETTTLTLSAFEGISFRKPRLGGTKPWLSSTPSARPVDLPTTLRLEIQSSHRLQIYSAKAIFRARFSGLRWWMHHHRFIAAIACITTFWATEVVFAILAWGVVALYAMQSAARAPVTPTPAPAQRDPPLSSTANPDDSDIPVPLSDTERIFPTVGRQPPLIYSPPRSGNEDAPVVDTPPSADAVLIRGIEADDEGASEDDDDDLDDDDFSFRDSGIGTGIESSAAGAGQTPARRRRGRLRGRPGFKTEDPVGKDEK